MQHLGGGRMVQGVQAENGEYVDYDHEIEVSSPLDAGLSLEGECDLGR